MKTLPKMPYIRNIAFYYSKENGYIANTPTMPLNFLNNHYRQWLTQFGFAVPVRGEYLQFPDDFPDEDLLAFKLRWG